MGLTPHPGGHGSQVTENEASTGKRLGLVSGENDMKTNLRVLIALTFIASLLVTAFQPVHAEAQSTGGTGTTIYLPMVQFQSSLTSQAAPGFPSLQQFIQTVKNGAASPAGVYVENIVADQVVQQPASDPNYVSLSSNVITQFATAAQFGVTGLLAHNNLAGSAFFKLTVNQVVVVVFGDGSTRSYKITQMDQLQALEPNNPSSQFQNAAGSILSASDVFVQYYTGSDHVTFQTCIAQNGISSWGRLFIVAQPL